MIEDRPEPEINLEEANDSFLNENQRGAILAVMKDYLAYRETPEFENEMRLREGNRRYFGEELPHILKEGLLTEADVETLVKKLWAFERPRTSRETLLRQVINENGGLSLLQEKLKTWYSFTDPRSAFEYALSREKIKQFGPAAVTEVLCYRFPEQCGIVNGPALDALNKLGFPNKFNIRTWEGYSAYNSLLRKLADILRTHGLSDADLFTVDHFLFFISRIRRRMVTERERTLSEVRSASAAWAGVQSTPGSEVRVKALAEALLWPEKKASELIKLAIDYKALLFSGPPGTGKTFAARMLAKAIAEGENIELIQFHPSYSYEDFVEGIRPDVSESGPIKYVVKPGMLRKLCERAMAKKNELFVLLIDEINRANIPKVFGELLYCIEYRGEENAVRLPYSGERFYIPENVVLIGTMNTADRSIAILDAALRRRFREVSFEPDPEVLERWWDAQGHPEIGKRAAEKLKALNQELLKSLGAHRLIGHTYFMDKKLAADLKQGSKDLQSWFTEIWENQLRPVLAEYLFARLEELDRLEKLFLESNAGH